MMLQDYITNALNGQSVELDVGIWEDIQHPAVNRGIHALVGLKLKQEARKRAIPNSEDFTVYGLPECPSERHVADLVRKFYEAQGFKVAEDYNPAYCSISFQHEDGREAHTTITTSPGANSACASVTSSIL